MTPIIPDTLQNNISLQDAIQYTSGWRDGSSSQKMNHIAFVKAFNINKSDIDQLGLLIPEGGSCRAYLGISAEQNAAKLIMVPVGEDGRDILSIENEHDDADSGDSQSTIFDFTTPCPSQCDEKSPLYGPQ